jgi:hypothetical protein
VTIGNSDDLGAFATARGTDREAPFFAPVKEASMKASSTRSLPRACSSSASTRRIRSSLSFRTHCWNRRWHVWYGGYLSEFAPLGARAQHPEDPIHYRSRVLPRPTSTIRPPFRSQDRFDQFPLGIAQFPASAHALLLLAFPSC